jgi:hypothetical protein
MIVSKGYVVRVRESKTTYYSYYTTLLQETYYNGTMYIHYVHTYSLLTTSIPYYIHYYLLTTYYIHSYTKPYS